MWQSSTRAGDNVLYCCFLYVTLLSACTIAACRKEAVIGNAVIQKHQLGERERAIEFSIWSVFRRFRYLLFSYVPGG